MIKPSTLRLRKLTLSAILSALIVVILYLGAVIEFLDLTLGALAALAVTFAVMEMGEKYPLMIYLAAGALSLLLLPNKLPAVLFVLMMGPYPMLKFPLERLHTLPCWVLKFLCFNASLTVIILITQFLLQLPDSGFAFGIPVYLLGNVTYFLFDIALSRLIDGYVHSFRKKLRVHRFFGA